MAEQENIATQESGLLAKWEAVANRFETISHQLADPEVLSQPSRLVSLNKERAEIEEPARLFFSYRELLEEISGTERMLQDASLDPELRSLAEEE
ncbi:MAG: PCRF domain-containing protein, partial [Nitrospirales bacterium]|nr:PCRF domain-containing protein [Nitrospirales bacterium]